MDYESDYDSSDCDSDEYDYFPRRRGYKGLTLEKLPNLAPNKKKLLVLSLGGVLCQLFYRYAKMSKLPKNRLADGVFPFNIVYKRPHCEEFMKFCLERFHVGIWSSLDTSNPDRVLKYIMRDLRHELLFVRNIECTETGFKTLEHKMKPIVFKELNAIWEDKDIESKLNGTVISSSNTLLIDDQPFTALLNPPYTAIFPNEYIVDLYPNDDALGPNGELRVYLEGLLHADDVPSYVKAHPYGKPAISAVHPDWNYYCNATCSILDKRTPNDDAGKSSTSACGESSRDIELGMSLEKLSLWPRKKLLVLSIGGVLCERHYWNGKSEFPKNRPRPDGAYGKTLVYKRPYCEEFMKFCLERFEVGIWSSAEELSVGNALDCIMVGLRNKLLFVMDQAECTHTEFKTAENKSKPLFLKELDKIWKQKLRSRQFSSSNTLLVDDEPSKALLNPPYTAIFPNEYKADLLPHDEALGPKGELRMYLEKLAEASDVPCYIKDHPFGKPAISDVHPDWTYYSKVVDTLGTGTVSAAN